MATTDSTFINDVLCFISTARNSLAVDYISNTVHAFYELSAITAAKDLLCDLCNEKSIKRKGDNKVKHTIEDIFKLFDSAFDKEISLPKFVAEKFDSLPPTSGFDCLANKIIILTNEIESLQKKINSFKTAKETYSEGMEDCLDIKQDIADIKTMIARAQNNVDSLAINCNSMKDHILPDDFLRPENLFSTKKSYAATVIDGLGSLGKAARTSRPPPRQPLQRQAHACITGSMQLQNGTGLRSALTNRNLDIFVGRCDLDTTTAAVIDHCNLNCKVDAIQCQQLITRSAYFKSFKLTVRGVDRNKLLDPELWPEGIKVEKFYNRCTHVQSAAQTQSVIQADNSQSTSDQVALMQPQYNADTNIN